MNTWWFVYLGGITTCILEFGFKLEINGQSLAENALNSRKEISGPTDMRLGEHQGKFGPIDEAKDVCPFGKRNP